MKTLHILKKPVLILLCILGITSCEKSEPEPEAEVVEAIHHENFMNVTDHGDTDIAEDLSKRTELLLHLHYSGDVSDEEISAKSRQAIKTYLNKNASQNIAKGSNQNRGTDWVYRLETKTRNRNNHGTDGRVHSHVTFRTSTKEYYVTKNLDNNGNDREEGDVDVYYFAVYLNAATAVSWVELKNAAVSLKGEDGWGLQGLYVFMYPWIQNVANTTGDSAIYFTSSTAFLDNNSSTGWKTVYTGNVGEGRLNF